MFTPEEIADRVRDVARQVATGGTRTERDDFESDALGLLFVVRPKSPPRITLYKPSLGDLEGWLASTLRRVWITRMRRTTRQVPLSGTESLPEFLPFPWERLGALLGIPFPAADRARIGGWKPGERADLLALSGLYVKLPLAEWEAFVVAAELVYKKAIPRPFPPADGPNDGPSERQGRIAAALGLEPNTLAARWMRKKRLLAELDCIRDLKTAFTERGTHP